MKYNTSHRRGLINIEKEILKLYDNGQPIKQIASSLEISKSNIHNYLKKNGRRRQRKHLFDQNAFSIYDADSCYWAGFIAADGCIDKRKTHIRVDLSTEDRGHLTKLLGYVKDSSPNIVDGEKEVCFGEATTIVKHSRVDVNSTAIVKNIINNFNVVPNKTFNLAPPVDIPNNMLSHYIRGYFDGDGSVYWNKSHQCAVFNISSGSKQLLGWFGAKIKDQVDYKFGDKALVLRPNRSIWCINHQHSGAKYILDWLYKDSTPETRLDRKYKKYIKYGE